MLTNHLMKYGVKSLVNNVICWAPIKYKSLLYKKVAVVDTDEYLSVYGAENLGIKIKVLKAYGNDAGYRVLFIKVKKKDFNSYRECVLNYLADAYEMRGDSKYKEFCERFFGKFA